MIVTTPTDDWLKQKIKQCNGPVAVCSPYVGAYLCDIFEQVDRGITLTFLTRTLITDFARRASDLDAVKRIAQQTGGILSLSSLHAKVYVISADHALVTSANATFSGMYRNRECGVEVTDRQDVAKLRVMIETGFGVRPKPKIWTANELEQLRPSVEALQRASPKTVVSDKATAESIPAIQLSRRELGDVLETFAGWTRLTIEGLMQIRSTDFTMEEVFKTCLPHARAMFPANRHIRQKLRQQMQRLRDLGLVAFLGRGRYRLLASAR